MISQRHGHLKSPVCFLDIDGVLNSRRTKSSKLIDPGEFDPQCVSLLCDVTHELSMKIVISSTWRFGPDGTWQERIVEKMRRAGWDDFEIFDRTTVCGSASWTRSDEIDDFLRDNPACEGRFVIIDDITVFHPHLQERLVWCDPEIGFSEGNAHELRRLLLDV